ncbi:Methionyl-tRNA formyltransferase [Paracholeplasma brassicae]|uniref:Methionyl-tRNA formyltransferase n=1 Tax=Acholeplasma brassicae TaxID=61635 RepID=U4KN40_9MOLU|nr:methionyl-tRNA formyltransferase [Paracholeplasma brassicae]CCV65636.1 Methionyl-tRNA formyltransferase [Paracholeplasma brassicae]
MKIVFMGTPSFALPTLEMLHQRFGVSLVVTQPDKVVGRKKIITKSPVKEFAIKHGIDVFQPLKLSKDYERIIKLKPDLIVTAAYGQMIPTAVLDLATSINVHGSILPKYRGGAPVQYAIKNGDKTTGVTIMYMAPKMDSGDIIDCEEVEILETDTTDSLMRRLSIVGRDLLDRTILSIINQTNNRVPQDETQVTFAYTIKPEEEFLDFTKTTKEVINHLRSLLDEPGGSIFVNNTRIKVYEIEKSDIISSRNPGEVVKVTKQFLVKTKDGVVRLKKIKPEGKKLMNDTDFLNGQKIICEGDIIK